MSADELQESDHDGKMPDARIVKSAHQYCQKRELHRAIEPQAGENGEHAETDCRSVSQFLQRIVRLAQLGLRAEEKIMPGHGPDAANIARHEEHLAIIFAENFVGDVDRPRDHVNPDESEMPLQRPAEPTADRELLGDID